MKTENKQSVDVKTMSFEQFIDHIAKQYILLEKQNNIPITANPVSDNVNWEEIKQKHLQVLQAETDRKIEQKDDFNEELFRKSAWYLAEKKMIIDQERERIVSIIRSN